MLYITEEKVKKILTVPGCIDLLRDAFTREFVNIPRYRLKSQNALLHVMSASIPTLGVIGLKAYTTTKHGNTFAVLLFDEEQGVLLSVLEANALGQIRTGAASGLATDLLANRDVRIGAVIGTGYQAETQLLAIDAVRRFEEIRIYSRNPENRVAFIRKMADQVRAKLVATKSAEEAVDAAKVVCTITAAKEPVLMGAWLQQGCHINAAGGNWPSKRELDSDAIRKCNLICVDHRDQSKIESGDLIGAVDWNEVWELADIVRGKAGRKSADQITLFKSTGIAVEDIAAANFVYQASK